MTLSPHIHCVTLCKVKLFFYNSTVWFTSVRWVLHDVHQDGMIRNIVVTFILYAKKKRKKKKIIQNIRITTETLTSNPQTRYLLYLHKIHIFLYSVAKHYVGIIHCVICILYYAITKIVTLMYLCYIHIYNCINSKVYWEQWGWSWTWFLWNRSDDFNFTFFDVNFREWYWKRTWYKYFYI